MDLNDNDNRSRLQSVVKDEDISSESDANDNDNDNDIDIDLFPISIPPINGSKPPNFNIPPFCVIHHPLTI